MGKKLGVATKLSPKVTFSAWVLKILLHVHSPKRENVSGKTQENFEGNFDPDTDKFLALEKLRPTLWNVRASCFQKSIDNYCLLLKLWDECLKESLDLKLGLELLDVKRKWKHSTFTLVFSLANDIIVW